MPSPDPFAGEPAAAAADPTAPDVDPAATTDPAGAAEPAAPVRRRWRRVALVTVVVAALLVGGGAASAAWYLHSVERKIQRFDAFKAIPEEARPTKEAAARDAMNFLVLGSDSRNPDTTGSRSDTIIIAHLDKDHSGVQLASVPRDTWVYIPKSSNGKFGDTHAKINAAYAWGGVPLVIQTVEAFTGVRIDHVVTVDFAGFKEIVDALGGVEINVERSFTSTHSLNANHQRHFDAGPQVMDGAAALDYARERFAFADGDFARIRHQQDVIKAILDKAATGGMLTSPAQLNAFLNASAHAVSVDETLNIVDTAMELRHLRSGNLSFYTSPSRGTGRIGTESVVLPDLDRAKVFYDAIRRDSVAEIAAAGGS